MEYIANIAMYSKALLAFLVILLIQASTLCEVASISISSNFTDINSLLAFKAAIKFDAKNVLANNWTLDTDFCNWYGVTCSKHQQRVTGLELVDLGIVGPISPYIGNLSFLTILDLSNNSFHGPVIEELGRLSRLTILRLYLNYLTGYIPMSLALCRNLQLVKFTYNELTGILSKNISTLPRLQGLYLGGNNLTGIIPHSFGNMSNLQVLALELNQFHGTILDELALLPRLAGLNLEGNYLIGKIPPSLFNISSLERLALSYNFFTGDLPKDTSLQLPNLIRLGIGGNQLMGSIPSHMYNASRLTFVTIDGNNFIGTLPAALPLSLKYFNAEYNKLQNEVPKEIGTLKNLTFLALNGNRLRGTIPLTIKGMESMQRLYLEDNELDGHLPEEMCSLRNLGHLFLGGNRFSGSIPECIGNLTGLQQLYLGSSGISSTIPQSLWSLDQLVDLNLSSNSLHGNLGQDFRAMKSLDILDLSQNHLSGNIPDFIGSLQSLTYLDLSWNSFFGPIPESFGHLISLVDLNISNNNLSGQIPKSLEPLKYLKHLNLSYNKLWGEIPSGGPFVNFTPKSFIDNQELCGKSISISCPSQGLRKSRNKLFPLSYLVPIFVVVLIVGALFYLSRKRSKNELHHNAEVLLQEQRIISYNELSRATTGFSEANLLGSGAYSHVYKGVLADGKIVAVKLLNLTVDGAFRSFDAECNVLRTVRHRNLVKIISTCTNPELRALVLEYIPSGTLEKWLYSHNYCLSFLQRVSIMIDVAVALDYLHCGLSEPVIHCDLKPGNVLLDEDMVAHVGDFGISKILAANTTETQTSTLGTFGYIAPEYGVEGRVSTKGDTYSYGIMLLETFTRKRPTDEIFADEASLRQWVSSSIPNRIMEVVDKNILNASAQEISEISLHHNLLAILNLGLGCSISSPNQRFEMIDVVTELNKIKSKILT